MRPSFNNDNGGTFVLNRAVGQKDLAIQKNRSLSVPVLSHKLNGRQLWEAILRNFKRVGLQVFDQ